MKIQESGENYLETILRLERQLGAVRSVDVANELGFTKPSISRAMGILKKADYIIMDEDGHIHLTSLGRDKAAQVYERHEVITEFLERQLGLDHETADQDACRMEHVISQACFDRIRDIVLAHRPA